MNLYLYLHHASAHPPGVIKGMIFGCLRRYKLQNSRREDYLEMIRLLFRRLKARGHDPSSLKKMIMSAANKLELEAPKPKEQGGRDNRLFIHMQYHPNGISRQEIRAAFEETCDSFRGTAAEVGQVTVAFSRPPNLKDKLTSARLHEVPGKEASTYRPG